MMDTSVCKTDIQTLFLPSIQPKIKMTWQISIQVCWAKFAFIDEMCWLQKKGHYIWLSESFSVHDLCVTVFLAVRGEIPDSREPNEWVTSELFCRHCKIFPLFKFLWQCNSIITQCSLYCLSHLRPILFCSWTNYVPTLPVHHEVSVHLVTRNQVTYVFRVQTHNRD